MFHKLKTAGTGFNMFQMIMPPQHDLPDYPINKGFNGNIMHKVENCHLHSIGTSDFRRVIDTMKSGLRRLRISEVGASPCFSKKSRRIPQESLIVPCHMEIFTYSNDQPKWIRWNGQELRCQGGFQPSKWRLNHIEPMGQNAKKGHIIIDINIYI